MSAPPPKPAPLASAARLLERLFRLSLLLFPEPVRREYTAEMQAVFHLRAQDAALRGAWPLLLTAFREARDLPIAAASARLHFIGGTMNRYFPASSDQAPWAATLLSLLPLLLLGPGRVVMFYTSGFATSSEQGTFFPYLVAMVIVALIGLVTGAVRRFPRWSYPYALGLAFAVTDLYNTYSYHAGWKTIGQNLFFLAAPLIFLALALPFLRAFYRNIKQDWTLLSYALFSFVLFFLAQFDRDEYPSLALGVLLPSLAALAAAAAHLRIRQAPARLIVLLLGTFAGLLFQLSSLFTGMTSIVAGVVIGTIMITMYMVILAAILLSPLLVVMIRQTLRSSGTADGHR